MGKNKANWFVWIKYPKLVSVSQANNVEHEPMLDIPKILNGLHYAQPQKTNASTDKSLLLLLK